jgi:osmotically inducible protein OsmC
MKTLYQTKASATGGRNGHVETEDKILSVDVRTPKELGGVEGYTNPEQLFAAGYAACFDSALNLTAKNAKVETGETTVSATVGLGQIDNGGFGISVKLEVNIPGVEKEVAQDLLEKAHQVCPYSNATRNNIPVELVLV